MAENEESKIILSVDKQAADSSLKSIKMLDDAHKRLGQSVDSLDKSYSDNSNALKKVSSASANAAKSIKVVSSSAEQQVTEIKAATNAIEEYEAKLRTVQASGTDLSGDIASSVGGIRGAVGAFGGGGASPALDIIEGFADIGEFAPRLKVQLESVGNAMRASTSAASGVVSGVGTLVGSFTGLGAAIGTVLTVAVPLALAVGGVALAMNQFNIEAGKQAQLLATTLDAQRSVNEAVATGLSTVDAQARIDELTRLRDAEQAFLAEQQAAYDSAIQQLGLLGGLAQQIAPQEQALADSINQSQSSVQAYNAEIRGLTSALDAGELAANDTALAEAELAKTREQEAAQAIQIAEQAAARDAQLIQSRQSLLENRAIAESNAEESAALERKFARQDEKSEVAKQQNELIAIRKDGAAKVAAIEKEIADLPNALNKELTEAQSKGDKALGKLQNDYYKNQIEATQDFAKEQGRIVSDTAKAAKRLAEDISDNLNKAVQNNDVIAFLNAQEEGQKQLRENAEDASESEKRRTEDFLEAQNEQRQAFQDRQAEILAGIAEERAKITESYMQRRAELEAQRQQEILNTQQALANAQARFATEEAQKNQEAERDRQRQAIKDRQEQAALERQIAAINSQISGAAQVESAFSNAIAQIIATANSAASSKASQNASKANGFSRRGDRRSNPYGTPGGSSGASSATYNINVGDIATGSQVTDAINRAKKDVYGTINNAMRSTQ